MSFVLTQLQLILRITLIKTSQINFHIVVLNKSDKYRAACSKIYSQFKLFSHTVKLYKNLY